jgi:[ribosomal protein S5]-alanine N-acetyltransferase
MKETPILKTSRLTLRPFTLDDVDDAYVWCSSFNVTKYLFWHPHRDKSVTERLVKNWVRKKRNYSWALDDGTRVIGEIQVIKDLPEHGFEVGYSLAEAYWRQGYMKEALAAVLSYLFTNDGCLYSYEETDERNEASRKLLETFGYQLQEIKKDIYIAKIDQRVNEACYRLSKEDYLRRG